MRAWLARHPRWTFHLTSTFTSWLNAVEGLFAKLTRQRLMRGIFRSVDDLKAAINRFVAQNNADPKPFIWTADPRRVLAAVKRGKQALKSVHELPSSVVLLIDWRPCVDRPCGHLIRVDCVVNLGRNCHDLSGGDTRGTSSGLKIEIPFQHKCYLLASVAVRFETAMRTNLEIGKLRLLKCHRPKPRARIIDLKLQGARVEMSWNASIARSRSRH